MTTEEIEIMDDVKLERPPLYNGNFFRLCLPKNIILEPNILICILK